MSSSREQMGLVQGLLGHTGQYLGLHLLGSRPPGTGARLQRPPAPGGGQGPRSQSLRKSQGKPRWHQHLGAGASLCQAGQAGQARGCRPGGPGPALDMPSLLPPPSSAVYWADVLALLVQQLCVQNSGGHHLWVGAPGWLWATPSPPPVCLPDDRWGGRTNSNSSNDDYCYY